MSSLWLLSGCVAKVAAPPDRNHVWQREPVQQTSAEQYLRGLDRHLSQGASPPPGCTRCVWVPGSQHFDGTRLVTIPGRWEELDTSYSLTFAPSQAE